MLPVKMVTCVERGFPALPALRFDHRMGQFALAHFQNGGADGGLECRPRGKPKAKPKPSGLQETAATLGTPISVVISSNQHRRAEAPCRSCANKVSAMI
jgi:hypothetical protein